MADVFVGAGSNVDPHDNLRFAIATLEHHFGELRLSPVYRSRPYGFRGDDFLNLVVTFATEDGPQSVVRILSEVEAAAGRQRSPSRMGPRTLDLDLLLYGEQVVAGPELTLPRPDLLEHAFVLGPLAELAGGKRHPVSGERFADLWAKFDKSSHPLTRVDLRS